MKLLIVLCLIAMATAAPASGNVRILRYEYDNTGFGGYRYVYEQSDGTRHQSRGDVRNEGREDEYLVASGEYSWVDPNGVTTIVRYTADENGYRPEIEQGPGGGTPALVVATLVG